MGDYRALEPLEAPRKEGYIHVREEAFQCLGIYVAHVPPRIHGWSPGDR